MGCKEPTRKLSIPEIRLCLAGIHSRRVGVALTVEKRVETRLRLFELVERKLVDYLVRRVDQTEDNHIPRGRGRPIKAIRETIKIDIGINELDRNMVYDRTLWRHLIHLADPTYCDKTWFLL